MKRLIEKCRQTGSIGDAKYTGHLKISRLNFRIEAVSKSPEVSNLWIKAIEAICSFSSSIRNHMQCTLRLKLKITI